MERVELEGAQRRASEVHDNCLACKGRTEQSRKLQWCLWAEHCPSRRSAEPTLRLSTLLTPALKHHHVYRGLVRSFGIGGRTGPLMQVLWLEGRGCHHPGALEVESGDGRTDTSSVLLQLLLDTALACESPSTGQPQRAAASVSYSCGAS